MTTYSNVVLSTTKTLVAATVDVVNFLQPQLITIINHSSTDTISARADGTNPTVDGDDTIPILPLTAAILPQLTGQVRLISTGTPKYTAIAL